MQVPNAKIGATECLVLHHSYIPIPACIAHLVNSIFIVVTFVLIFGSRNITYFAGLL